MLAIEHIFIFILCLVVFTIILTFLFSKSTTPKLEKQKPRAHCPLCNHILEKGKKVHSSQTEIGDTLIETRIKGCVYCVVENNKLKRTCPICKKDVPKEQMILATSNPKMSRLQLSIKGCRLCYPQGFTDDDR